MQSAVAETAVFEENSLSVKVLGEKITAMPQDLYIPPGALKVFLEAFEGPLDLLLYLIKKQNLNILDIPIAQITQQYVSYIELMQELQIELAAEYLVMAAMLAEIKSRLLLPKPIIETEEQGDPRAELLRRLQEYERFKQAAEDIDQLAREQRDIFVANANMPKIKRAVALPVLTLEQLQKALLKSLRRAKLNAEHLISAEVLSIRERMSIVLGKIKTDDFIQFTDFFDAEEGRMGVVVSLVAVLELSRQRAIECVQHELFAPIYIKARRTSSED